MSRPVPQPLPVKRGVWEKDTLLESAAGVALDTIRHGQDSQDGDLQSRTRKGCHGGAGSSGGHARWSSWPWPRPSERRPLQLELFYPPPKNSLGYLGGIRSPPGLDTETGTGHTQTRQSTG